MQQAIPTSTGSLHSETVSLFHYGREWMLRESFPAITHFRRHGETLWRPVPPNPFV